MTHSTWAITSRRLLRNHSHKRDDERFWIPFKTYAADGGARPNSGGTPFRQPCPAYPFAKGERHRRNVSARNVSEPYFHPETSFSKARSLLSAQRGKKWQDTTSLDELAEPI